MRLAFTELYSQCLRLELTCYVLLCLICILIMPKSSKRLRLDVVSGWEGLRYFLSPVTDSLANHEHLRSHVCRRGQITLSSDWVTLPCQVAAETA